MDELFLDQFKKTYQAIIPEISQDKSWSQIQHLLPQQDKPSFPYKRSFFISGSVLVLLLASGVLVEASTPGQALYPIKVLSDNTVAKVFKKPEITVERRATDILKNANKSPEQVEKATQEYKKSLEQAVKVASTSSDINKQSLRSSLQKEENRLKRVQSNNPKTQELIQEAIETTQKTRGEVKGASTHQQSEHSQKENSSPNEHKE